MPRRTAALSILLSLLLAAAHAGPPASASPADRPPPAKAAAALGTAFTYQGRLSLSGNPVTESCDFQFQLWDAASGGAQVGGTVPINAVQVQDGYFTVQLDFGAVFNGSARWLAVAVRCPAGSGSFESLSPRQPLTAAPQALYALASGSAASADAAPWGGLTGVPAGFADGTDNDTTYTNGFGLTLNGSVFSVLTSTIQARVGGACGAGFAIRAIGADGTPVCEAVAGGAGDITAVYPGLGLGGGGTSGPVTLTVNFAGSGSANTVARSDHNHAGVYALLAHTHPGTDITSAVLTASVALSASTAPWGGLTGVPAGFADGADNDTTYTNGFGLGLNSTTFSVVTTTIQARVTGVCAPGSSIRAINAAGAVTCETDDSGGAFWSLTGNAGTTGANFLGTTDNKSLTLAVSGTTALRLLPTTGSPNLLGGYGGNTITGGAVGVIIGGGGASGQINTASASYAIVAGGVGNTASGYASTVGGGTLNTASGQNVTLGGGYSNTASAAYAIVGGGRENTASGQNAALGGGLQNTASGNSATLGGGFQNSASGDSATVGGGVGNTASGAGATVGGGGYNGSSTTGNQALGAASTIGGGYGNIVTPTASYGVVGGGQSNVVTDTYGTVSGGANNSALGIYTTVSGGQYNTATSWNATVGGGYINVANGLMATVGGGSSNDALGNYATVAGGVANDAHNFATTVGGGNDNDATASAATVSGGQYNKATAFYSAIGGGSSNTATGIWAAIGGGESNRVGGAHGTLSGGHNNVITGTYGTVGGGRFNTALNQDSTVGGGVFNTTSADGATVAGGSGNTAGGYYATIGGGSSLYATGYAATISGGEQSTVLGNFGTVGGGNLNHTYGDYGVIAGGNGNTVYGYVNTIAGGTANYITGTYSAIGGGRWNRIEADLGTIAGGGYHNPSDRNYVTDEGGTIGGGGSNVAGNSGGTQTDAYYATVAGGWDNDATNKYTAVGGGENNWAAGVSSAVPGGKNNVAFGDYSFAAGCGAQALHAGSFVWADSRTCTNFGSQRNYQFRVRAWGGFMIDDEVGNSVDFIWSQPITTSTGAYLSWGGTWTNASDAAMKENYAPVDGPAILAALARLPIRSWNYIAEGSAVRHVGPTAQDFAAAFSLGASDTAIATVDADGVSLAAIQVLYELSQTQAQAIEALQTQNADLEARLSALEQAQNRGPFNVPAWMPLAAVALAGLYLARRHAGERK